MVYNILRGGRRGQPLVDLVRAVAPDVLLVNECPKRPLLWRRDCARLAARCGLRPAAGGRPAGSNLVAVRPGVQVVAASALRLPQPLFAPRRGIAAARLRVDGAALSVVCCHLGLARRRRAREAAAVVEVLGRLPGPVAVAGDLNEPAGGPSWRRLLRAGLVDHGGDSWPTFPADSPARRIDALLVRDATVLHHGDPGVAPALLAAASDHRPVLAVLSLPGAAAAATGQ